MLPGCSRENPFPSIQIWILCYSSFLAVTQAQHTDLYLQKKKKKAENVCRGNTPKVTRCDAVSPLIMQEEV